MQSTEQTSEAPIEVPGNEAPTTEPEEAKADFKKSVPREYFESLVVTLIMALFGMTFIVQAVKVPTGSMKNTIYIGDQLLVNKFIFGPDSILKLPLFPHRNIHRGDVIVFKYPRDPKTNYVKRVIALPGETVEFNPQTNRVYIDGKELPERRVTVKEQSPNDAGPLDIVASDENPQGAEWTAYYYERDEDAGSHRGLGSRLIGINPAAQFLYPGLQFAPPLLNRFGWLLAHVHLMNLPIRDQRVRETKSATGLLSESLAASDQ